MAKKDEVDYSPYEEDSFNVWVELGALDQGQQHLLANDPLHRYVFHVKSSSPEAEDLIHEPLGVLLAHDVPGVHEGSRITTTVVNHHLGLRFRIIRATATVDDSSGDVALELHKQTW
jgi:hypothetical protein